MSTKSKEHNNKLINIIKQNYGIIILGIYILILIIFAIVMRDNIYVTLNDNMDSNVPIYKMIRDNDLFWKFNESIPFLGGEVLRAEYRVELSVQSWIYALFPTLVAYYAVYILKVLGASLGFYFLSIKIKEYDKINTNPNLWCLCGLVYGILGTWPHAALGFASLPWWCLCVYMIYKTGKKRYIPILLIFVFTTSFTMLALFALFYTAIFLIVVSVKERKINFKLLSGLVMLIAAYTVTNSHHVLQGLHGSRETIKSLKSSSYSETVFQSLGKFKDAFLFKNGYYHTGGATLRYVVIPVCTIFLIFLIISAIRKKIRNKKVLILYITIYGCIIFNTLACCFDNNALFRRLIPFASGFGFSRFAWLSPFMWLVLFALVCDYINKKVIAICFLILAFCSTAFDPMYTQSNSMYNELYCNIAALLGNNSFKDGNHEWTWREYYSEDLFDTVKNEIGYDGEWAVAYGIEPSVLQYNGIKTLDGYYSNYPLDYHDKFEKLIYPELERDEAHKSYWERSSGMRAYIWSSEWEFLSPKEFELTQTELYMDMDVFKEMNGKYIFSRVQITNSAELGISLINTVHTDEYSPYTVYVYSV